MSRHEEHGIDLPPIPSGLLSSLDEKFPERCPSLTDSDREVWYKAGQHSVVKYLKDQQRRQEEAADILQMTSGG